MRGNVWRRHLGGSILSTFVTFWDRTRTTGVNMNAIALPTAELPDADLLARCLRGEREAFGALVLRYQGIVCAQAYSVCGDFSRSEDVAQEAFVNAWRKLGSLRDHTKFKSWLCGIARHLALRISEERAREHKRAIAHDELPSGATPHEAMASREEEALVWEALEALPEAYRSTLVLFYREHQSVFEVARALDLSEDAVKQRLSRGRAMLRQQVAQVVEHVLARTRPGPTLAAAILAAIGASIPATSTAATMAAAAAKTAGSATASISLPLLGSLLGGGIGVLGARGSACGCRRRRPPMSGSGRRFCGRGVPSASEPGSSCSCNSA